MEGIVNYISLIVQGKSADQANSYIYETKAIELLSQKIGNESIISSAWQSDEISFKETYEQKVGKTYETFKKYMRTISHNSKQEEYQIGRKKEILGEMEDLLQGKEKSEFSISPKASKLEPLSPMPEGKAGFEDISEHISNQGIRKTFFTQAISYIKKVFRGREETETTIQTTKEENDVR